jgi:NAD(P)-dependent dehydrogenase (short-subunit alcohol dehydrogenase family)
MITGAPTSIGGAIAQAFAQDGASAVVSDRRERRNYIHPFNATFVSFELRYFIRKMPAALVR